MAINFFQFETNKLHTTRCKQIPAATTRNLRSVGTWFLSSLTSMGVCTCNLVSLSCFWHSVLKVCIYVFLLLGVSTESVKTILKQVNLSHSRSVEKNILLFPGDNNKIVSSIFCLQPLSWGEGKIYTKMCIKMAKLSMKNRHLFPNHAHKGGTCPMACLPSGSFHLFTPRMRHLAIPVAASTSQLVTTWHHRNCGPTIEILPARRNLSSYKQAIVVIFGDLGFFPNKTGNLWQKFFSEISFAKNG